VDERLRAELVREIREFLSEAWARDEPDAAAAGDRRVQLSAVLLMVSVLRADSEDRHDEHRALEAAVERALGLEGEGARALVRAAEEAMDEGVSFAAVVGLIARRCTVAQKRHLVEALWRIAFADAELAGQEEYLVRKVAEQLGLGTADLVETKIRAREAFLREEL
jgi:uncharacterized tellurite resistance protein B-like protein